MQLAGSQFTATSAVFGNDISTLPDFPAEIRAPAGSVAGVSGFQINFSDHDIHTPGDRVDALIAMNPAALKANIGDLIDGGILILDDDQFTDANLKRAGYDADPVDTGELGGYRVFSVPISSHTLAAVKPTGLGAKEAARCKNIYALGLIYWLYDRPLDTTTQWIKGKFGKRADIVEANILALKAGHNFGETAEIFPLRYRIPKARLAAGTYRNITGNQALAVGLITAARKANKTLFCGAYPITPASDILHDLSRFKHFDVRTMQAEDEIAAATASIGAAFAGALAVTTSSGPGIALKQEAIGLAVMTELPLIVVNVQRGGPSTGLPTKTEQADLWQAIFGRNGECPTPVIAARSPGDCFWAAIDAVRIAIKYMTPVMLLSDGYVANSSEPWSIPRSKDIAPIPVHHATDPATFEPYRRDGHGARPWAIPGTPGLQHRIGGLEKRDVTGDVCYEPENHEKMTYLRQQKVDNVVHDLPDQEVYGQQSGDLLLVSWGGTFGSVRTAAEESLAAGRKVGHMHLRWLNPMPRNVGAILKRFKRILVCELNLGQLQLVLRGRYAVDALGLHKVQGRPFHVNDITAKVDELLGGAA